MAQVLISSCRLVQVLQTEGRENDEKMTEPGKDPRMGRISGEAQEVGGLARGSAL